MENDLYTITAARLYTCLIEAGWTPPPTWENEKTDQASIKMIRNVLREFFLKE